jgi:hypothetical protein
MNPLQSQSIHPSGSSPDLARLKIDETANSDAEPYTRRLQVTVQPHLLLRITERDQKELGSG